MSDALVIIDMQNDYFPGGNMEVINSENAAQRAQLLLNKFRTDHKVIIHIRHVSTRAGATFLLPATQGIEIHERVSPEKGEKIFSKNYPNSFRNTNLEKYLHDNGVKRVIFCGMMSHMCIDATVRTAFDKGFRCIVAEDACATKDLSFAGMTIPGHQVHASFMAALSAVYAKVLNTSEILKNVL